MKRLCALMAAFVLMLMPILSLAQMTGEATDEERVAVISQVVEDYLSGMNLPYSHHEAEAAFYFDYALDNALSGCQVRIEAKPNQLYVLAFPTIGITQANRGKVARLIALINWNHNYAQLYMDMDTGELASGSSVLSVSVYPGMGELRTAVDMSLYLLETYGDAIAKVALLGEDPRAAFEAAKLF